MATSKGFEPEVFLQSRCPYIHIHLLCLTADAVYINTDWIKFKIKQYTNSTKSQ